MEWKLNMKKKKIEFIWILAWTVQNSEPKSNTRHLAHTHTHSHAVAVDIILFSFRRLHPSGHFSCFIFIF